ncbi:DUF3822 family protein [Flavicella marina]|uniref:DUF3822 family protein n=1 Tax=Flavicella marina TaxID=1475951 RepID=UPI001265956A|nr:DUF3822 family protein [Flavicella marina]
MTKRNNNIRLKEVENTDLEETILSIQINLDGFSFCIYNPLNNKIVVFQDFDFEEKALTPEKHLNALTSIFDSNEFLKRKFKKVTVIHQNELATLVPDALFEEQQLKSYLQHTIKLLPIDYVTYDSIKEIAAKTVYIPFVNLNNYLFGIYGSFEYFHVFTKLIESLSENALQKESVIFANVNDTNFECIAFNKGELQLINRFNFNTAEDFLYYILFVAEQLEFDPESFELQLLGDIEKHSEIFELCYQYIRNVNFYEIENQRLNESFKNISKHHHYLLLNQEYSA